MTDWKIDLGDSYSPSIPLEGRESISILLGAGFSVPKGYPTGDRLNKEILEFDKENVEFSNDGKLYFCDHNNINQHNSPLNLHQKRFIFCKRLIKEYAEAHEGHFDYECFYEFLKSDEAHEERYRRLCNDISKSEEYLSFITNIPYIYNQMIEHLLKDKDGNNRYDNAPNHIGNMGEYDSFLRYIASLSRRYIVNIHTLNHDLLFESFNKSNIIGGAISDGFDEYGSDYFGILRIDNIRYHCRLERFTGRYHTPIRLFKLHGSIDYVKYYKSQDNAFLKPKQFVKIKAGIGVDDIIKGRGSKKGYDAFPFAYHGDYLTGITLKTMGYNEPLLFKKLFKRFKKNLKHANKLIIIGYGGKDEGINKIIMDNYDYHSNPTYIVDKYATGKIADFGKALNAKIYQVGVEEITSNLFDI